MPGYLTAATNNRILDLVFGGVPFAPAPELYIGLSLLVANRSGIIAEPGSNYRRIRVRNSLVEFPEAFDGRKQSAIGVEFDRPDCYWGRVLAIFIADHPTGRGRHILAMSDLKVPRDLDESNRPHIRVGELILAHQ